MTVTAPSAEEHDELRRVARSFLEAEYPSERIRALAASDVDADGGTWKQMVDLGWTAMSMPTDHGGAGYGLFERCLLLEEMGRVLTPGPFLSCVVLAADLVELAGGPDACAAYLPALADGSRRAAAVAAGDLGSGAEPAGRVTATDNFTLSGPGGMAFDAAAADVLVVVARTADRECGLFAAEAASPGVALRPVALVDRTRKVAGVDFTAAPAVRLDPGDGTAGPACLLAHQRGVVSLAAEMIGGAQRCLEMTLAYVKDRHQFGKPIGSFQAVKHRCADLALLVDTARESVRLAAEVIDTGQSTHIPAACAAAKMAANHAYLQSTLETIQLHGGIGYTWEHDAHLFYKRALVSNQALGTTLDHQVRLAAALDV